MKSFTSLTRIFYTLTLIFFGLGALLLNYTMWVAIPHGHGSYHAFWQSVIVDSALWALLLVSRILYYHSPKWLWLGFPTILAIYGFIGFAFVYGYIVSLSY